MVKRATCTKRIPRTKATQRKEAAGLMRAIAEREPGSSATAYIEEAAKRIEAGAEPVSEAGLKGLRHLVAGGDPNASAGRRGAEIERQGQGGGVQPGDVAGASSPSGSPRQRVTEQGNRIDVASVRRFLKRALEDDAVIDGVNDILFEHVVAGRYHPSVVVASLPSYINEIVECATQEDWRAVAEELIAEARAVQGGV
jgi:hypothetical protein